MCFSSLFLFATCRLFVLHISCNSLPCSLRASTFVLCTFLAGRLLNAFLATRTMTYIANSLWNRSNGHWKNLGVYCEKDRSRMWTICMWPLSMGMISFSLDGEPAPTSAPSTGCPLVLSCGWTSTELILCFTLVTNSVRNRSPI
jgi:hypothetical protein